MRISRDCWQCEYEDCGHVWLASSEVAPDQCSRCKRRKWDSGVVVLGGAEVLEAGRRRSQVVKPIEPVPESKPKAAELVSQIMGLKVASAVEYVRPAHAANCQCGVCVSGRASGK